MRLVKESFINDEMINFYYVQKKDELNFKNNLTMLNLS
jgi:hypothetical protein